MEIGVFYSWEILSERIAIKNGDKTFVEAGETGIPQEICWFFDCGLLEPGETINVVLRYLDKDYEGVIRKKQDGVGRVVLSWRGDLHDMFKSLYTGLTGYPSLRFQKIDLKHYIVSFVHESALLSDDNTPSESEDYITGLEGKKKVVYTTKYERNPQIRRQAILLHGCKCEVCGFDFEKVYGELGKDYIEVHHIKPLSTLGEECEVNPDTDMICLCSNCHRMIHRNKSKVLTPDELRRVLKM